MKNKTVRTCCQGVDIDLLGIFKKYRGRIKSAASFTMIIKPACPKEKHLSILTKFLALYGKYLITLPTLLCFVNTGM